MSSLSFAAILLCLASLFGFINDKLLRLPSAIGMMVVALLASFCILAVNHILPGLNLRVWSQKILGTGQLPQTLLNGALSLLLFAGALHVRMVHLWSRKFTVLLLATGGVAIATILFALGIYEILALVGLPVPLIWCIVLGAILAPTDPVAVAGLVARVGLPDTLQAVLAGESLFNDGVGVVIFNTVLAVAVGDGIPHSGQMILDFARETGGSMALGFGTGWLAYEMMRRIDEYTLEIMISLALATGTYALANALTLSGPIAVVVSGLLIGNHAMRYAMSETTQTHLMVFWTLIDELLNALLFLLIGFEMLGLHLRMSVSIATLGALPLAVIVRGISVVVPTYWLHIRTPQKWQAVTVLTWGGLRGGISVALALTLPPSEWRDTILCVCYGVVVFTVIVQGLTMEGVVRRIYRKDEPITPSVLPG